MDKQLTIMNKDNNLLLQFTQLASLAIPLCLGIISASPEPCWLDSPEFTAAAQSIGLPHPPGHPLYVILAKAFTLLPMGNIALRVSLASVFFTAIAGWLVYKTAFVILRAVSQEVSINATALLSLFTSVLTSCSYGWWLQSTRQEVYSLAILAVLAALYPLILFNLQKDKNTRLLFLSAFFFGLGLANHHFIMLVALPAAIPTLVAQTKNLGKKAGYFYLKMAGSVFMGLTPYLLLPIRSLKDIPITLGAVHSPYDFYWVISAKVYQKSMTRESTHLHTSITDALFAVMDSTGPIILIIALAGAYMLLRRRSTQIVGITLLLAAGITLFMRTLMGFDPYNPDFHGYILTTIAATILLSMVFFQVILHVLCRTVKPVQRFCAPFALLLVFLPLYQVHKTYPKVDLSDFNATRIIYKNIVNQMPHNTVAITNYYKLFFLMWSYPVIDGSRPDIHTINPQFFGYPGYLASVAKRTPEIKELAWSIFVKGQATEKAISDLALNYPVRIDPIPWHTEKAISHMTPSGFMYTAHAEPSSYTDVVTAAQTHDENWTRLYRTLDTSWKEHETWRLLTWAHYLDALFFASRGDRASAAIAIERSRNLGSSTPQINALEDALREGKGPIDTTAFLPYAKQDK